MASFQYKDICYPSETLAAQAFVSHSEPFFYINSSTGYTVQNVSQTVTSAGLITFTFRVSNGGLAPSQTFQLQPCDDISSKAVFDKMSVQDMLFAAFFILIFVIGFGQGRGAK